MAKNAKNCQHQHFFAILGPLQAIEHHQASIWWVICENRLRIGFRNEFLTFTSENEVDLDELHILKITFTNGLEIGMGNFPQDFLQHFLQ